jgi:ElaB/YqjD/DUF883 family membrane-anchored ribosome-binding protein
MNSRNDDDGSGRATLAAEAGALRESLAGTVEELAHRMTPANLLHEGLDEVRKRGRDGVARASDRIAAVSRDLAVDAAGFAQSHAVLLGGSAAAAVAAALMVRRSVRRRAAIAAAAQSKVPLYAAYAMEDPAMINEEAPSSWDKVRTEAAHLGTVVSENYASAREKASALVDGASEQAAKARDKARSAASEAGAWASRQSADHPVGLILAGAAAGLLIAALLPARRRSTAEALGDRAEHMARDAWEGARRTYQKAAERVEDVELPKQARQAKARLDDLADMATDILTELGHAAMDRLRRAK